MSVTPSPIGGFAAQFFDNNGVILSGGKIYTYAAGTTTPQATYTSASGVTPHANPIILDSAGRVPGGEIWLTDGLVYKFVIETATGSLLGTYDNITGVNSNFVNYTVQEEVITATAGQTVFNLSTINYTPGTNSLSVYIDGVNQYVGDSYLETDSDTVTFTSGVHVGGEVKFTTAIQTSPGATDASNVSYDPPFVGSVVTNVEAKLAQTVSVKDFGAVGDGVADDRLACQNAIDAVLAAGGGTVLFPEGTYLLNGVAGSDTNLNGLLVPYTSPNGTADRIILQGQGRSTVLKAGSNDMYIVRFCDSHGSVRDMSLDADGNTGVIGLGCVPESITQTASLTFQLYNIFSGLYILNCDEGAVFKAGPDVGGVDSGCWYNILKDTQFLYCKRGIWLRSGTNASSSPANRNSFMNVRIGQTTNTGVQIDAADTCKFYALSFEGISTGTSPNATPTAIKIAATDVVSGADNNTNTFFGCSFESNTRDLDNLNTRSQFFDCNFTAAKINTAGGANVGLVCLGGEDASQTPQVALGSVYQTNGQLSGFANGLTFPTSTGTARVALDGQFVNTVSFEETSGTSASIANGATFVITVPTPRRPQLLFLYSGFNLTAPGVYLVCGDGSANISVTNIVASAGVAVAGTAANQITVTNNFGGSAAIKFTLAPFGVAVAP